MSKWGINEGDEAKHDEEKVYKSDIKPTKEMKDRVLKGEQFTFDVVADVLTHLSETLDRDKKQVIEETVDNLAYVGVARKLISSMGMIVNRMDEKKIPQENQEAEMARVVGLILKELIERGEELKEINDGKA